MMSVIRIIPILVFVFLSSCSPTTIKTYSGPERPIDEIATLRGYEKYLFVGGETMKIISVDDESIERPLFGHQSIELSPGPHKITAKYEINVISSTYWPSVSGAYYLASIEMTFEGGQAYELEVNVLKDRRDSHKFFYWNIPIKGREICIKKVVQNHPKTCAGAFYSKLP